MLRSCLAFAVFLTGTLLLVVPSLAIEPATPVEMGQAGAGSSDGALLQLAQEKGMSPTILKKRSPTVFQLRQVPAATALQFKAGKATAGKGFRLERAPGNRIMARSIGGGPGATIDCVCKYATGKCDVSTSSDQAVCTKSAGAPCLGQCTFVSGSSGALSGTLLAQ